MDAFLPAPGAVWPDGYRIEPMAPAIAPSLLAAYRDIPVCIVGDVMGRHVGARGLTAYHPETGKVLCGRAIPVRVRPGDNLMIHVAMALAGPGDVIVVDGGGDLSTAVIGGLMRTTAKARGLGGFVIDGALRDLQEWAEGGIAAYAAGHSLRGPSKAGPGEINSPVACAGLAVLPGDLVLGDGDGVIALSPARAAEILPRCLAKMEAEHRVSTENASGEIDVDRFLPLLRQQGCPL